MPPVTWTDVLLGWSLLTFFLLMAIWLLFGGGQRPEGVSHESVDMATRPEWRQRGGHRERERLNIGRRG